MSIVLRAENVSKQYRLGEVGTGTISHDLNRWWARIRGKDDPFLKIGETNDRTSKGESEYVWALRDINFEVEQGQAIGIIGRNGAGKSTLLKLLSKVTKPTTGSIQYKGRIASLLEVGTGFHPEMTGRENIYLNGAILGMTRKEITRKFDEIVDFAGVERYIDTPVKRYSSGMYVRLAFAVAAHLDSEILIVDEVLAVGDAEFQKKCLGKMGDVTKGEGRTILFVSHNMGSIRKLCNEGIILANGTIQKIGGVDEITNLYLKSNSNENSIFYPPNDKKYPLKINSISILAEGKKPGDLIDLNDKIKIEIDYNVNEDNLKGVNIAFGLSREGTDLLRTWDIDNSLEETNIRKKGNYLTEFYLPDYLNVGNYTVSIGAGLPGIEAFFQYDDCISFEIENIIIDGSRNSFTRGGMIRENINWDLKMLIDEK